MKDIYVLAGDQFVFAQVNVLQNFTKVENFEVWNPILLSCQLPVINDSIVVIPFSEYIIHKDELLRIIADLAKTNKIVFYGDKDSLLQFYTFFRSNYNPEYIYILDGYPINDKIISEPNIYFNLGRFIIEMTESLDIYAKKQSTSSRLHTYFSLNCNPRSHRLSLIHELYNNNLLQKGHVVLHKNNKLPDEIIKYLSKPDIDILQERINSPDEIIPDQIPGSYYVTYNLEIVAETTIDSYFITEKTIKPLLNKMPFIMVSGVGYLNFLRKLGFKTFHSVFDEAYDLEYDINLRIKKIVNVVSDLLKSGNIYTLYNDCYDITEYNLDHLLWLSKKEIFTQQKQLYNIFNKL